MSKGFALMLSLAVAASLATASPAAQAAPLLGPGTYPVGPFDVDVARYSARNRFETDQPTNLSLRLNASSNETLNPGQPFIRVALLEKGGGVLFQRKIEFDDSIDLNLPTLMASLPASAEGTSYLLRIRSFLGNEGGDIAGTFTLSAVPLPPALLLFGSAVLGLIAFAARRKDAQAAT